MKAILEQKPVERHGVQRQTECGMVAQLAISYIPVLQTVFGTHSPTLIDNLVIVLTGFALLIVLEIEKVVRLSLYQRKR